MKIIGTDNEQLMTAVLVMEICRQRELEIPALLESEARDASRKIAARNLSPSQMRELRQAVRAIAVNEVDDIEMVRNADSGIHSGVPSTVRL